MSFLATAPDDGPASPLVDPAPPVVGAAPPPVEPATLPDPARPPVGAAALQDAGPPLVDPAALQDLGAGLDDPAAARDFARDYIKMWDHRYQNLARALGGGDAAESLDVVLSLKISSAMAGAVRLSWLAGEVESAVRSGDMDQARSFLPIVAEDGRKTMDELQAGQDLPGS